MGDTIVLLVAGAITIAYRNRCHIDIRVRSHSALRLSANVQPFRYNDRRIDLLGHLIELYWTHVHVQQTPPMTAESFFADLKTQKCPSALCYAMCAAAIAYSLNSAVRLVHQGYGLAKKARKCLEGFPPHEYLRRAQTYCVLTLYEISYGSAVNAWSDLGWYSSRQSR